MQDGTLETAARPPALAAPGQDVADLAADLCRSLGLGEALGRIGDMAAAAPRDGNLRAVQGRMLYASGRHEQAVAALSAAAACGSDIEILDLLARAVLPGPQYHEHLRALHRWLRPATYLEIGVFDGDTLALALAGTHAIGVDPRPRPACRRGYAASTDIHTVTSDAFFARPPGGSVPSLDLAFIDGLHLFEQVLRDFVNVERHCHADSVVVLHDTLPVAAAAAARQRQTRYWCGDVWKMLPCLRRWRPDLRLLTIPTFPSGLTLVRGLDPGSRVLEASFDAAVAEHLEAALPQSATPPAWYGDIANDPEQVRDWLLPH